MLLSLKEHTSFQWRIKCSSQIKVLYLSHFFLSQILTTSKETDGPSPHEKVHVHLQISMYNFLFGDHFKKIIYKKLRKINVLEISVYSLRNLPHLSYHLIHLAHSFLLCVDVYTSKTFCKQLM